MYKEQPLLSHLVYFYNRTSGRYFILQRKLDQVDNYWLRQII
jgi:ABC-type multidrug transport system fused ATPase/permease subunit